MINGYTTARASEWEHLPLCCSYVVAHFGTLALRAQEDGIASDLNAQWALGGLADGQLEVLGLWLQVPTATTPWKQACDDLEVCGVEQIRFVSTTASTDVHSAFRGATALPSPSQLLDRTLTALTARDRISAARALRQFRAAATASAARTALVALSTGPWGAKHPGAIEHLHASLPRLERWYALARPLRRLMLSAEEAADHVQNSLARAAGRHGCFADREAAASYLGRVLKRAERSLGHRGLVGRESLAAHRGPGKACDPRIRALDLRRSAS